MSSRYVERLAQVCDVKNLSCRRKVRIEGGFATPRASAANSLYLHLTTAIQTSFYLRVPHMTQSLHSNSQVLEA